MNPNNCPLCGGFSHNSVICLKCASEHSQLGTLEPEVSGELLTEGCHDAGIPSQERMPSDHPDPNSEIAAVNAEILRLKQELAMKPPITMEEANELQAILRTMSNSGRAPTR